MRIAFQFIGINALFINRVDFHLPGRMNDLFVVQHNAYMNHFAIAIFKKCKVAQFGVVDIINGIALFSLHTGITE